MDLGAGAAGEAPEEAEEGGEDNPEENKEDILNKKTKRQERFQFQLQRKKSESKKRKKRKRRELRKPHCSKFQLHLFYIVEGGPPRTADRAAGAAEGRVEDDQDQDP